MGTKHYTELDVWQKAHALVMQTYQVIKGFPRSEAFVLTEQACKAAISIPANIAEGYGRRQARDKMRFYNHSEGSLQELSYYFLLAKDLGYLTDLKPLQVTIVAVESMLRRLIASIAQSLPLRVRRTP
jgi:four helix bundle protein